MKIHDTNIYEKFALRGQELKEKDTIIINKPGITNININSSHFLIDSMVGAGGAGGSGIIQNGIFYSGGGGGAGGGYVNKKMGCHDLSILQVIIGEGGSINNLDGGDTILNLIDNLGNIKYTLTAKGGLRGGTGVNNKGGAGGKSDCSQFNGENGQDGETAIACQSPPLGGNGGSSIQGGGGLGGLNYQNLSSNNLIGQNGRAGGGGGGGCPGVNNGGGKGGDGELILRFF